MLATSNPQIQQVANAICVKRASGFAAFRLRFGMTPRECRKRHG